MQYFLKNMELLSLYFKEPSSEKLDLVKEMKVKTGQYRNSFSCDESKNYILYIEPQLRNEFIRYQFNRRISD